MPYIYVEEVPEGAEVADVVSRADYDSAVKERDASIGQVENALQQLEDARKEVRDTKAKYADFVLGSKAEPRPQDKPIKSSLPVSSSALF